MLRHLGYDGQSRKQLLLLVACMRRVWKWLPDPKSQQAVEATELFADGLISEAEFATAREVASSSKFVLPSEPHWRVHALIAQSAYQDFLIDAIMNIAEATAWIEVGISEKPVEERAQVELLRDIFGNPFQPVIYEPNWRTSDVVGVARTIYDERAYHQLVILADALMDAGCDNSDILSHCRSNGVHVRGCWVVDLILEKRW
jgi:hypothetical protein